MNKQIKSLDASNIIGDLPKLPFVRILGAQDKQHSSLAMLPHAQINLVDTVNATGARVLLRFSDIKLDEYTDPGVAVTLLAGWITKLLEGLNAPTTQGGQPPLYKLAAPNNARPYMPAWRPGGWDQARGFPQGFGQQFRPAWPDARPFGERPFDPSAAMFPGFNNPDEYQAALVAQSLMRDIGSTNSISIPSLSIIFSEGKDGAWLRFEGMLGHGLTFNALKVPSESEMAYASFFDSIKNSGSMAGFFHVGGTKYLYSTGHQHGYHEETRSLLTQAAVSDAFNHLWAEHHKAMGLNALPIHFDDL